MTTNSMITQMMDDAVSPYYQPMLCIQLIASGKLSAAHRTT